MIPIHKYFSNLPRLFKLTFPQHPIKITNFTLLQINLFKTLLPILLSKLTFPKIQKPLILQKHDKILQNIAKLINSFLNNRVYFERFCYHFHEVRFFLSVGPGLLLVEVLVAVFCQLLEAADFGETGELAGGHSAFLGFLQSQKHFYHLTFSMLTQSTY